MQRRRFLGLSGAAALGVLLGFNLDGDAAAPAHTRPFNAWIRILAGGRTILLVAKAEMGQGVFTALPMLLAEELDVDWASVEVRQAPVDPALYDHLTVGSNSIQSLWLPLRRAGALGRHQLMRAAALRWQVAVEHCRTDRGTVVGPRGEQLTYAELVQDAASLALTPGAQVPLKPSGRFRMIGTPLPSVLSASQIDGSASYGLDVRRPGLLRAVIARCPTLGGSLRSFQDDAARSVAGVEAVFALPATGRDSFTRGGVAVVAKNTWQAMEGRRRLGLHWAPSQASAVSSDQVLAALHASVDRIGGVVAQTGDPMTLLAQRGRVVEARFELPFLAHATLEPMNATIHVQGSAVEAWLPTQNAAAARQAIARVLRRPPASVRLHQTLMGGGFGRRDATDFAVEAAQVAERMPAPVQLVWSREDDVQFDRYRPMAVHRLQAALGADGLPIAWLDRLSSVSIGAFLDPPGSADPAATEVGGARDIPYQVGAFRLEYTPVKCRVPVGWWRSVEDSVNAFAVECFIDDLAAAAGQDACRYRLALLRGARRVPERDGAVIETERLRHVLMDAADQADWGRQREAGQALGLACHFCRGSYIAVVAKISADSGRVRVRQLWTAVDCGFPVNPLGLTAQIEGGLQFGVSAALHEAITLDKGHVMQSNFHDYPVLRMAESPAVRVRIIDSTRPPSGAGELAVPVVAPAIANAVFALTGRRPRSLPIRIENFTATTARPDDGVRQRRDPASGA
jgi:isoquinoline 1-oxidoreductase beta subunit